MSNITLPVITNQSPVEDPPSHLIKQYFSKAVTVIDSSLTGTADSGIISANEGRLRTSIRCLNIKCYRQSCITQLVFFTGKSAVDRYRLDYCCSRPHLELSSSLLSRRKEVSLFKYCTVDAIDSPLSWKTQRYNPGPHFAS